MFQTSHTCQHCFQGEFQELDKSETRFGVQKQQWCSSTILSMLEQYINHAGFGVPWFWTYPTWISLDGPKSEDVAWWHCERRQGCRLWWCCCWWGKNVITIITERVWWISFSIFSRNFSPALKSCMTSLSWHCGMLCEQHRPRNSCKEGCAPIPIPST
jgi:hypothetical protein